MVSTRQCQPNFKLSKARDGMKIDIALRIPYCRYRLENRVLTLNCRVGAINLISITVFLMRKSTRSATDGPPKEWEKGEEGRRVMGWGRLSGEPAHPEPD